MLGGGLSPPLEVNPKVSRNENFNGKNFVELGPSFPLAT